MFAPHSVEVSAGSHLGQSIGLPAPSGLALECVLARQPEAPVAAILHDAVQPVVPLPRGRQIPVLDPDDNEDTNEPLMSFWSYLGTGGQNSKGAQLGREPTQVPA